MGIKVCFSLDKSFWIIETDEELGCKNVVFFYT